MIGGPTEGTPTYILSDLSVGKSFMSFPDSAAFHEVTGSLLIDLLNDRKGDDFLCFLCVFYWHPCILFQSSDSTPRFRVEVSGQ